MPEHKYGLGWPIGDAESHRRRALLLAQSLEAHSAETQAEFERLAQLYERLARRVHGHPLNTPRPTLGALIPGYKAGQHSAEAEWVGLIRATAAGDHQAFETLYLWTHRFVFGLLMAIMNDTFAAKEMTLRVFQRVRRHAVSYDPARDTVMAWMMNQARLQALDRHPLTYKETLLAVRGVPCSDDVLGAIETTRKLQQSSSVPAMEDEPDMYEVAPGVFCKVLASDIEHNRLSMLVRLVPGGKYPPHIHAGVEQLYLLCGDLWIDARKLTAGDYHCAERGTAHERVWSERGCTGILVTSSSDTLA